MTFEEIKDQIDSDITNKTTPYSITPTNVGTNLKAIVDKVEEVAQQLQQLDDIAALEAYTGSQELVFVKDVKRGGIFYLGTGTANNGTVFDHATSGQWIRVFDESVGYNAQWWGATGDGVTDDLAALQSAVNYCSNNSRGTILTIPTGVYRVTDTLLIGYRAVDEDEMIDTPANECPSFGTNLSNSTPSTYKPIIIQGQRDTVIHGDFTSESLKAIVYYGIRTNITKAEFAGKISRLKIVGQGAYTGTTELGTAFKDRQPEKNQIGLACALNYYQIIEECYFSNLAYGLAQSDGYGSDIRNCKFYYNEVGFNSIGGNCGTRSNWECRENGTAIRFGETVINFELIWTEFNDVAVNALYGGSINFINLYNETERANDDENYSIILGGTDESGSIAGLRNVVFNGGNIQGDYENGNQSNGILINNSCGNVRFIGTQISSIVTSVSSKFSKIFLENTVNLYNNLILEGPAPIYQRNDSGEYKNMTLSGYLSAQSYIESQNLVKSQGEEMAGRCTNMLTESSDLDGTNWSNINGGSLTKTINAVVGPYGLTNGTRLVTTATDTGLRHINIPALTLGQDYVFSVWMRADADMTVRMDIADEGATDFEITTEWKRYYMTTNEASSTFVDILSRESNSVTWYVANAQLEEGTVPGNYIETTSTAITTPVKSSTSYSDGRYRIVSGEQKINIGIPSYADNAAALSGGLIAGDLYQTSGALKIVT